MVYVYDVLTMAPTATAAFIIGGKTIESALSINMTRFGGFGSGKDHVIMYIIVTIIFRISRKTC